MDSPRSQKFKKKPVDSCWKSTVKIFKFLGCRASWLLFSVFSRFLLRGYLALQLLISQAFHKTTFTHKKPLFPFIFTRSLFLLPTERATKASIRPFRTVLKVIQYSGRGWEKREGESVRKTESVCGLWNGGRRRRKTNTSKEWKSCSARGRVLGRGKYKWSFVGKVSFSFCWDIIFIFPLFRRYLSNFPFMKKEKMIFPFSISDMEVLKILVLLETGPFIVLNINNPVGLPAPS